MKLILSLLAASFATFAVLPAHAATITPGFNVTASLASKCEIVGSIADVAFAYTAFQGAAQASTGGGFSMRCTNTLPYSFAVSGSPGTVLGLNYTLTAPAGGVGTGAAQTFTIGGSMASGQAGTCGVASCGPTTVAHTLTVTY